MASDGRETILSLLCEQKWTWDSRSTCTLTFHENGVGEIVVFDELSPFICSEFDWKPCSFSSSASSLVQPFNPEKNNGAAQFNIQITLTKRRLRTVGNASTEEMHINEANLEDGAFAPREHQVRLEWDMSSSSPKELGNHSPSQWHRLRLVFNPSPLPTMEQWKYKPAARALRFWERDTFIAKRSL